MQGPFPSVAPPRVHKMAFLMGDRVDVAVAVNLRWTDLLLGCLLSRDGRRHEVASTLDSSTNEVKAIFIVFMFDIFCEIYLFIMEVGVRCRGWRMVIL